MRRIQDSEISQYAFRGVLAEATLDDQGDLVIRLRSAELAETSVRAEDIARDARENTGRLLKDWTTYGAGDVVTVRIEFGSKP